MTERKLDVPYISQYANNLEKETQKSACGLACLKMTFDFLDKKVNIETLNDEREYLKGRLPEYGSSHQMLVILLRNHGILAYPQEFRADSDLTSKTPAAFEGNYILFGLEKICSKIDQGLPTIVSVWKNFSEVGKYHLVLVVGYQRNKEGKVENIIVNDPDDISEEKGVKVVSVTKFIESFRKFAIFLEK